MHEVFVFLHLFLFREDVTLGADIQRQLRRNKFETNSQTDQSVVDIVSSTSLSTTFYVSGLEADLGGLQVALLL